MKVERIGNYEILGELGEGGMGIVYRARQEGLDRIVALKVLLPHLSKREKFVKRFLMEARSAARLDHPNIVTIYDVGEEGGTYYFSMQYVKGEDLSSRLSRGPLKLEEAVEIISQVADGLSHAHEKGVIHRDIKPANVIIDEEGTAVITDFGIAKAAWEEKLTTTGQSIGTIEYMSPEQFEGGDLDARCDVYSLGATFYRMATGRSPFPGETTQEVMYRKFRGSFQRPTVVNDSLPEWINGIIAGAMAEDPGDRFNSAAEFKDALKSAVSGKPMVIGGAKKIDLERIFRDEDTRVVKGVEEIDRGAKTVAGVEKEIGGASREFRRKRIRVLVGLSLIVIIAVVGAVTVPKLFRFINSKLSTAKTSPPLMESTSPKGEAPVATPPPEPPESLRVAPVIDHDDEIKRTIGTVFEAWEALDVDKYMSVWSYSARQELKNGVVRNYEELKRNRIITFQKYTKVDASWEILNISRRENRAIVDCHYRMTFDKANGESFTEDERERYVLILSSDGKWLIAVNYDYM